jgi:hypothetical protein
MSIHQGSCMFGHRSDPFIAALSVSSGGLLLQASGSACWQATHACTDDRQHSTDNPQDADPEYSGSCGTCYEVFCVNGQVTDG